MVRLIILEMEVLKVLLMVTHMEVLSLINKQLYK